MHSTYMHQDTFTAAFDFFNRLEDNNNREWFNAHKKEFKRIETDVKTFYTALMKEMNQYDQVDQMKVFRIYRDVRFSKDKTPFKTHFGGSFSRIKPRLRGGYYLQIAPEGSFIATGFWAPDKEDLVRIRREFEADDTEIRAILKEPSFQKIWGGIKGEELKTAPKGFDRAHTAIDLIRKKQFLFTREFTNKEVLAHDFPEVVHKSFKAIRPYFDYMTDVLTTNLNGESLL